MIKEERGFRLVPIWLPVVVVAATVVCELGATSATFHRRMTDAEHRLDVVERERDESARDYQNFKTELRRDVAEIRTDLRWIRETIARR